MSCKKQHMLADYTRKLYVLHGFFYESKDRKVQLQDKSHISLYFLMLPHLHTPIFNLHF